MVVKVYISGISGNKEVKKRQQRVLMILESRNIKYEVIDIAEPNNEADKDFMQTNSTSFGATACDSSPRHPLPPQIFNDEIYCGDYDLFDLANENDEIEKFLKLVPDDSNPSEIQNGDVAEEKQANGTVSSSGDAVVESTTINDDNENNETKAVENGTHQTIDNDIGVSDETVDSSNVEEADGTNEDIEEQ